MSAEVSPVTKTASKKDKLQKREHSLQLKVAAKAYSAKYKKRTPVLPMPGLWDCGFLYSLLFRFL